MKDNCGFDELFIGVGLETRNITDEYGIRPQDLAESGKIILWLGWPDVASDDIYELMNGESVFSEEDVNISE